MRWRIGDGKSVKMWQDAWVSDKGSGKLITPMRFLDHNTTVDGLMDVENQRWRIDIISEVLFPIDTERIVKIPISSLGGLTQGCGWAVKMVYFELKMRIP